MRLPKSAVVLSILGLLCSAGLAALLRRVIILDATEEAGFIAADFAVAGTLVALALPSADFSGRMLERTVDTWTEHFENLIKLNAHDPRVIVDGVHSRRSLRATQFYAQLAQSGSILTLVSLVLAVLVFASKTTVLKVFDRESLLYTSLATLVFGATSFFPLIIKLGFQSSNLNVIGITVSRKMERVAQSFHQCIANNNNDIDNKGSIYMGTAGVALFVAWKPMTGPWNRYDVHLCNAKGLMDKHYDRFEQHAAFFDDKARGTLVRYENVMLMMYWPASVPTAGDEFFVRVVGHGLLGNTTSYRAIVTV